MRVSSDTCHRGAEGVDIIYNSVKIKQKLDFRMTNCQTAHLRSALRLSYGGQGGKMDQLTKEYEKTVKQINTLIETLDSYTDEIRKAKSRKITEKDTYEPLLGSTIAFHEFLKRQLRQFAQLHQEILKKS